MRMIVTVPIAAALAATALAGFDAQLAAVDNTSVPAGDAADPSFRGGTTHFTYDLLVTTFNNDDWTEGDAIIRTFNNATIYEHPDAEGMLGPTPGATGSLLFNSYYTSPGDPNGIPNFLAGPTVNTEQTFSSAIWDDDVDLADGTYNVLRLSIVVPEGIIPVINGPGAILADVDVDLYFQSTGGAFNHYDFTVNVPEPGAAAGSAAIALLALRRRTRFV